MEIDLFTFIAQVINFSILVWLLDKFLFKRISRAMQERKEKMAALQAGLEKLNSEAEALKDDSAAVNRDIREKAAAMLEKARQEALSEKQALLSGYRNEAEEAKKSWERYLGLEKEAFLAALKERSSAFTLTLAGRVLADLADADLSMKITGVFTGRLRGMAPGLKRSIAEKAGLPGNAVRVASSFVLDEAARAGIISAVYDSLGYSGGIDFMTDPGVCGVELAAGGYKVSWSVREYLKDINDNLEAVWAEKKILKGGDNG